MEVENTKKTEVEVEGQRLEVEVQNEGHTVWLGAGTWLAGLLDFSSCDSDSTCKVAGAA